MTLKNSDALDLLVALRALSTFNVGPKARYAISKNMVILSRLSRDLNEYRKELEAGLGSEFDPNNDEQWNKFIAPFKERMEASSEFPGMLSFPFEELNAETNEIPLAVINLLTPLLTVDNG